MPTTGRPVTGSVISTPFSRSQAVTASDEDALDLGGALADLEHLRIAPVARYRELVHEAVAAEDLRRVPSVVDRDRRGVELRDRSLALERLTGEHPRHGVAVGATGDMGTGRHVGDPERDGLVGPDR